MASLFQVEKSKLDYALWLIVRMRGYKFTTPTIKAVAETLWLIRKLYSDESWKFTMHGRLINWVLQKLSTLIGQLVTVLICVGWQKVKQIYELSCLLVHKRALLSVVPVSISLIVNPSLLKTFKNSVFHSS